MKLEDLCLAKVDLVWWSRVAVGLRWADKRLGMISQVGGTVNGDLVCVEKVLGGFEYDRRWWCGRQW